MAFAFRENQRKWADGQADRRTAFNS